MNRLQLCQRIIAEAGVQGVVLTSTLSQTGLPGKVVAWADSAWNAIQGLRNWDWMWEQSTVTVLAGTSFTTGSIPAARYIKDATTTSTGAPVPYMPWERFRTAFPTAIIVNGTPACWTIRPDKAFQVSQKPTANTNYTVQRYTNPVAMAANTDTPALAAEHHMLIVWRAVQLYAGAEEDTELYKHAGNEYRRELKATGIEFAAVSMGNSL